MKPIEEMDLFEVPYDVNSHEDNVREIMRVVSNDHPTVDAFLMDMTFLSSNYGCMYGQCCSNRPQTGVSSTAGCCTESVDVRDDVRWSREGDLERIERLLPELDETIFANKRYAEKHGVFRRYDADKREASMRTRTGACIFSNPSPLKEGDPLPGCAFHHLAMRKNVSHVHTKPEVCWEVPLWNEIIEREDGTVEVLVTGMSRGDWGGEDGYRKFLSALGDYNEGSRDSRTTRKRLQSKDYIGWWCIDTPDAYSSSNPPVYESEEHELRMIMTDTYYERFRGLAESYTRNTRMPGEKVNGGRPTIATVESLFSRIRG